MNNMKKKILIGVALTFVVAVVGWNINWSLKHDNTLSVALHNLVAIAGDEGNQGTDENVSIEELYKKNHINDEKECTVVEVYNCVVGVTIPNSIPWIGGMKCEATIPIKVEYDGMQNHCKFTNNPLNACDYYRCRKNI